MMAAVRLPSFFGSTLPPVLSFSPAAGPVGKWETRPHRVFHFSIRAVHLSFFLLLFLSLPITNVSAGFSADSIALTLRPTPFVPGSGGSVDPSSFLVQLADGKPVEVKSLRTAFSRFERYALPAQRLPNEDVPVMPGDRTGWTDQPNLEARVVLGRFDLP